MGSGTPWSIILSLFLSFLAGCGKSVSRYRVIEEARRAIPHPDISEVFEKSLPYWNKAPEMSPIAIPLSRIRLNELIGLWADEQYFFNTAGARYHLHNVELGEIAGPELYQFLRIKLIATSSHFFDRHLYDIQIAFTLKRRDADKGISDFHRLLEEDLNGQKAWTMDVLDPGIFTLATPVAGFLKKRLDQSWEPHSFSMQKTMDLLFARYFGNVKEMSIISMKFAQINLLDSFLRKSPPDIDEFAASTHLELLELIYLIPI